ncbi:MAG: hypothetical protein AAFX87_30390 [Bacteroidota bacterium]
MRTSLTETEQIEQWLLKRGDTGELLVTEARVLSSPELKEKARWQMATYDLVHLYGREKLRQEIKEVEQQLFHHSRYRSFQQKIRSIFKR